MYTINMILEKLQHLYHKTFKLRKYKDAVDASYAAKIVMRLAGTCLIEVRSSEENNILTSSFSPISFMFYILWNSIFIYCSYVTHYHDETILRLLHSTKLKRYGDDFERCTSIIYVSLIIFLIPWKISGNRLLMQNIIDIDLAIEKFGDIIDFHKIANTGLTLAVGQCGVYIVRIVCIWMILSSHAAIPWEKLYQVVYSDALALVAISLFCFHLSILRDRYMWINRTLYDIKMRNSWEYKIFLRGKTPANMVKVVELQDKHICEKIKTCARVYGMMFKAVEICNNSFGLPLLLTQFHYGNYIVLYLFYFMEATASGLFHDLPLYINFVVYTIWEIAIALGIHILVVYYSESTVAHAKRTACIIHEIINEDISATVNSEAMKLSMQLQHEIPVFTILGLYDLTYVYLQQGFRSITTYLIILLQFVTEKTSMKM